MRGRVFSLGVNLLESRMGVDLRPSLTAGMSCILGVTMTSTWPHWFPVYMALAPSLILEVICLYILLISPSLPLWGHRKKDRRFCFQLSLVCEAEIEYRVGSKILAKNSCWMESLVKTVPETLWKMRLSTLQCPNTKYIFSIHLSNELSWNKLKEPVGFHESKLHWKEGTLRDVAQIRKSLPLLSMHVGLRVLSHFSLKGLR